MSFLAGLIRLKGALKVENQCYLDFWKRGFAWAPSAGITRIRFKGYILRQFTTPVDINLPFFTQKVNCEEFFTIFSPNV